MRRASVSPMPAWYDRAFGPWYLRLYPHRDHDEAARAMAALLRFLPVSGTLLDVGCGPGRHLTVLRRLGFAVAGLDRSPALLAEAGRDPALRGRLVRGDMRALPFSGGAFAAVLSMFTSFGYFADSAAHARLLAEYARVVAPEGRLVLDVAGASWLRATLVPETVREVEGHRVRERRRLERTEDGEQVVKEVEIDDAEGRVIERYREEVALYERPRLLDLLSRAGWRERASLGDYDGSAWRHDAPRLIIVADRRGVA